MPDSISTDLHTGSMNAGMKDMTNVMSKILNQNVPLADVIRMSTINPATQIKRPELGHLSVGAGADVAVLRVDEGKFGFLDARGARADGTKRIVCELTLRNGNVVWDLNGRAATGLEDVLRGEAVEHSAALKNHQGREGVRASRPLIDRLALLLRRRSRPARRGRRHLLPAPRRRCR